MAERGNNGRSVTITLGTGKQVEYIADHWATSGDVLDLFQGEAQIASVRNWLTVQWTNEPARRMETK